MYTRQGYFIPTSTTTEATTAEQQDVDAYSTIASLKAQVPSSLGTGSEQAGEGASEEQSEQSSDNQQELYIYPPLVATGLDL